jgi:hypothetical protein
MEKKIAIVEKMVANGYHLLDESVESFASRNTLENLERFLQSFLKYKGIKG